MKALLIPPTGLMEVVQWATLSDLVTLVGGGADMVEPLSVPAGQERGHVLLVDEEQHKHHQRINMRASMLFPGHENGVYLHGNVLVVAQEQHGDQVFYVDMDNSDGYLHAYQQLVDHRDFHPVE